MLSYLRERFVNEIKMSGISDQKILEAFKIVPREIFTEREYPLDIIYSDTVIATSSTEKTYTTSSQPSLMALFMEWGKLSEGMKVLEIGSGTGYNACVMSRVVGEKGLVVGIECNEHFCQLAIKNAKLLQLENVKFVCGDGISGFDDLAPYDVVIVTLGVDFVPATWVKQLKNNGTIVAPINLYLTSRQPAFVFSKTDRTVTADYKLETRFIKAEGSLGDLNWRNTARLQKILDRFEERKTMWVRAHFTECLNVAQICTWNMCDYQGNVYGVEEFGYTLWKNKCVFYGDTPLFDSFLELWKKTGHASLPTLRITYNHDMKLTNMTRGG